MKNEVVYKAHSERYEDGNEKHKLVKGRTLDKAYNGRDAVVQISEKSENTAS